MFLFRLGGRPGFAPGPSLPLLPESNPKTVMVLRWRGIWRHRSYAGTKFNGYFFPLGVLYFCISVGLWCESNNFLNCFYANGLIFMCGIMTYATTIQSCPMYLFLGVVWLGDPGESECIGENGESGASNQNKWRVNNFAVSQLWIPRGPFLGWFFVGELLSSCSKNVGKYHLAKSFWKFSWGMKTLGICVAHGVTDSCWKKTFSVFVNLKRG